MPRFAANLTMMYPDLPFLERFEAAAKDGFKAVIAENFAEIFFGNSTTLGMPCVTAAREDIAKIAAAVEKDPSAEVVIDLVKLEARFAGHDPGYIYARFSNPTVQMFEQRMALLEVVVEGNPGEGQKQNQQPDQRLVEYAGQDRHDQERGDAHHHRGGEDDRALGHGRPSSAGSSRSRRRQGSQRRRR